MSGVTYRIEYDDSPVQAVLNRLIATGQSPRDVMRDIAVYGENSTQLRFDNQISPDGKRWKPSHRGVNTLKGEGHHLFDSIVSDSGEDHSEWGADTSVIYAAIHQFGGVIRPKNKPYLTFKLPDGSFRRVKQVTIPARPFIGINQQDEENIIDIVNRHLAEAVTI